MKNFFKLERPANAEVGRKVLLWTLRRVLIVIVIVTVVVTVGSAMFA